MDSFLKELMDTFKSGLTLDGRQRVINEHKELDGNDINAEQKPEAYTIRMLINPILEHLGCTIDNTERRFEALKKNRREVDCTFITSYGERYLLEAKPLNAELYAKKDDGAVNQIKDALKLTDVVKEYKYGIATDGLRWIIINVDRNVIADLSIINDFDRLKKILSDNIVPEYNKEEISKKFYSWYSALLFGGTYKNHDGRICKISEEDCLVNSVMKVVEKEDREEIAQSTIDRLVFIKFLESKGIIKNKIIHYMLSLEDDRLNVQLRSLFFDVMNTKVEERDEVNPVFKDIPYLNGSLFVRIPAEIENPDYRIKAAILRMVFEFLDSFTFSSENVVSGHTLDPEILGYIFEMSMLDVDRKGTGAFYTPRDITAYMSKDAIHSKFVENVRDYLRTMGYNDIELGSINTVEDVYGLRDITLANIFSQVLIPFKVCDNACGSGAFLLSAADTLFDIYKNINHNSGLRNSEIALKKLILVNNIYGVDLNLNAVEIAKLRLWLWLVDAYSPNVKPEALPNIDYHLKSGNSLIGIIDLNKIIKKSLTIEDFFDGMPIKALLAQKRKMIEDYQHLTGVEARQTKKQIDELTEPIRDKLSLDLYNSINPKLSISYKDFLLLRPFHWGFEFSEVFENGGFDVIIGNPPYIQLQKMSKSADEITKNSKKYYENGTFTTYDSNGDIFCLFYERSNDLLKPNGILSYITSNKWMRNEYGVSLRNYFISETKPRIILDMADLQLFKSATVECGILSFSAKNKTPTNSITVSSCIINNDRDVPHISSYIEENAICRAFNKNEPWSLNSAIYDSIENKMKMYGAPLKEWDITINFGIKTGRNEVFIIDEKTKNDIISKDSSSKDLIKPILRGRDLKRYCYEFENIWMICTFPSLKLSISDYPAIEQYLLSFDKRRLEQSGAKNIDGIPDNNARKKTNNKWFELQDNVAYWEDFTKPKIIWGEISDHTKFALDENGEFYTEATTFLMTGNKLHYLLAILNSKLSEYAFSHIGTTTGMGTTRWKKYKIELLSVPVPDEKTEESITNTVKELIKSYRESKETAPVESKLDQMIYELYHLSEEEINEVENNISH